MDQTQARMHAVREILENDAELRQALSQVETAKQKQRLVETRLREAEALVKVQEIKIEQAESSLYGGSVRNPKELQDLQNDVASLKRHLETLEERELEAMLELEAAQGKLQAAEAELSSIQSRRGDHHKQLIEEQATLSRNVERLQAERQAVVTDIPGPILQLYTDLRARRRGVAVAEVADNACSACGTTLNAALQQTAHSTSQFAYCPSCGRILYAS
jgi:predicted  nucleic acid-binding Zn-ribbon protein